MILVLHRKNQAFISLFFSESTTTRSTENLRPAVPLCIGSVGSFLAFNCFKDHFFQCFNV